MDYILIIANVLSIIANCSFTCSSLFEKKNIVLLMQITAHVLSTIAEILTKAFSGMVQEIVSLIRNIALVFVPKEKSGIKILISFIAVTIGVIVGVILNIKISNNVWYGYIPIFATVVYTIFLVFSEIYLNKQELLLKMGLLFNAIGWASYTVLVKLYAATAFNCITIVMSIVSIILIIKKSGKKEKEEKL